MIYQWGCLLRGERYISKLKKNLLLFNYSCMPFSPSLHPTPAELPSLPHLPLPPRFCPCVLYSSSCNHLSSLSPPHSPLAIARLFLTSIFLNFYNTILRLSIYEVRYNIVITMLYTFSLNSVSTLVEFWGVLSEGNRK